MNLKNIIISGFVAGLAAFLVGSILYMNPFVSDIYSNSNYPCSKSMDLFGGLGNWLLLMLLGVLLSTIFIAFLYSYTEKGLGIIPLWKRGLVFGVLLWLVSNIPTSYYTWLMYTYPDVLNLIEMFTGFIERIVAGMVLAVVYDRLK